MTVRARLSACGTTRARTFRFDGAKDWPGDTASRNCSPPLAEIAASATIVDTIKGTLIITTPDASKATSAPDRLRQIAQKSSARIRHCAHARTQLCAAMHSELLQLECEKGEQSVTLDLEDDGTMGLQRIQSRSELLQIRHGCAIDRMNDVAGGQRHRGGVSILGVGGHHDAGGHAKAPDGESQVRVDRHAEDPELWHHAGIRVQEIADTIESFWTLDDDDVERHVLCTAKDADVQPISRLPRVQIERDERQAVDRFVVDAHDDVLDADTCDLCGAAGFQIRHDHAPILCQAEPAREIGRDGLQIRTDLTVMQMTESAELL